MLGLGMGEILIVALAVLLVVGPENLPKFARSAGKMYGQLRRAADDMRRALVLEADKQDADERYADLLRRREAAKAQREAMQANNPGVQDQGEHLPGAPAADHHPHGHDGDQDLQALMEDPNGPYASGTSLDDVAKAWAREPRLAEGALPDDLMAPLPETLPPGVTAQEWAELPPHIKALLREKAQA